MYEVRKDELVEALAAAEEAADNREEYRDLINMLSEEVSVMNKIYRELYVPKRRQ